MEYVIPLGNWTRALADALEKAQAGDTIVVQDVNKQELALHAAERMQKVGVAIVVRRDTAWKRG